MSSLKHFIIFILIGSVVVVPARRSAVNSVSADAQLSPFEATVSSVSDPDPRDNTTIAVSPTNDQVIVGASKVIRGGPTSLQGETRVSYYFSSDAGRTWATGLIGLETPEKTWSRMSTPSIASDLDGNFYLCVLVNDNANFDSGVYVLKSTDDGRTFKDPAPVVFDIGHLAGPKLAGSCEITVDVSPTSPFKNTVYVAWVSTEPDRTVILTSHRARGAAAFTEPKTISHKGDMRGPSVATGPNGEFYAAWLGIGNPRVILFNASTDGGETFLPSNAAPSLDLVIHELAGSLSDPNPAHRINGVARMNSYPVIAVDCSAGANRGMIYLALAEARNGRDADIFVKRLTPPNGFRPTLGAPVLVNNDMAAADQFFPWLSIDSSTGAVEVAFYDQRDDPAALLVNLYLGRSTDGGDSFAENTRISSVSSDPRIQADVSGINGSAIGIGDYVGLVAVRGKAHTLWTDTRRGKQEIFYGRLDFGSIAPPPPPDGLPGDKCQSPRTITSLPYLDTVDTRSATGSSDDPLSCTGTQDTNTVWYSITPPANTTYGVDTSLSDYDTVVSVYTGSCGALTSVACSDDFGNPPDKANRSVLTFAATAGVTYLILASGKGIGGSLKIRVGYPVITNIQFTSVPFGDSLQIDGWFLNRECVVTAQQNGEDIALPNLQFLGPPRPDGSGSTIWASRKKLAKLLKHGSVLVRVECPSGSGNISNTFLFTR